MPSDKSITQRAILLAAIANGDSVIYGRDFCGANIRLTIEAVRSLGIEVLCDAVSQIIVRGKGLYGLTKPTSPIYCGGSATLIRLLAGILSAQEFDSELSGDEHLAKRPLSNVVEPLNQMGAHIKAVNINSQNGEKTLLKISGGQRIRGILYRTPIKSAQIKTAMMFAALYAKCPFTFIEGAVNRDHTERLFDYAGISVMSDGKAIALIPNGEIKPFEITVPGDTSSAAFMILAKILCGDNEPIIRDASADNKYICYNKTGHLVIKDVLVNPTRTGFIDIIKSMGGNIDYTNIRMEEGAEPVADILVNGAMLRGVTVSGDLSYKAMDELPLVAVAGAFAKGRTVVKDAAFLHGKECDRIKVMAKLLTDFGANVTPTEDGYIIEGPRGKAVEHYGESQINETEYEDDHRMAMAMAVAMAAVGKKIDENKSVEVSYPNFYTDLEKIMEDNNQGQKISKNLNKSLDS